MRVTVWIMKNLFFSAFSPSTSVFSPLKCLPRAASSASAPRRRSIWIPPRSGRARRHRLVCWSELATRQVHDADARSAKLASSSGNALFKTTSSSTTSSHTASACSARPGGDQEKRSTGRSHTRSSPTSRLPVPPQPRQPPQPLHSLKTSPAAALPSQTVTRRSLFFFVFLFLDGLKKC